MIKASFSVEAVLLVPFMIVCFFMGIYFVIYAYDRALMLQDAENLCCLLLLGEDISKDPIGDHAYLAISNLSVTTIRKSDEVAVKISADWTLPIAQKYNKKLICSVTRKTVNPVTIMFLTEDIKCAGGYIKEWMSSESSTN